MTTNKTDNSVINDVELEQAKINVMAGYNSDNDELKEFGVDGDGKLKSTPQGDYITEVSRGNVVGQSFFSLVGHTPNMTAGQVETIWDATGKYVYLTADTTLYASSSSASDTTVTLSVTGLDDTYTEVTRTVTLNGQTQVALSGDMFRIFIGSVTGATEPLGDVYIAESDTLTAGVPDTASKVKSKIIQGVNRTQNALYTVPAGKTLRLLAATFNAPKGVSIFFEGLFRFFGSVFFQQAALDIYQFAFITDVRGLALPEKTDFEIAGTADNSGSPATYTLRAILFDN